MLLEQLGYLLEVARCHSISIAAERLHLTQPAVSQAIKSIETELGETIFVRSKNGVFLTEAGERLLPCVERIMAAAGEMRQIAAQGGQPQEEISGYLRLSVNPALSFGIFQSLLPVFSQRYPQVKVYIHERISDEVVQDILQGQCDFGVFINDAASLQKYSAHEELLIGHLFTEKMFIITQAASPLAMRSSVTLEDIKDYPRCV